MIEQIRGQVQQSAETLKGSWPIDVNGQALTHLEQGLPGMRQQAQELASTFHSAVGQRGLRMNSILGALNVNYDQARDAFNGAAEGSAQRGDVDRAFDDYNDKLEELFEQVPLSGEKKQEIQEHLAHAATAIGELLGIVMASQTKARTANTAHRNLLGELDDYQRGLGGDWV